MVVAVGNDYDLIRGRHKGVVSLMWENVIVAIATAIVTSGLGYLTSRNKDKTSLKQSIQENKVNLEKTNTENAVLLFKQYQSIASNLQDKVDSLEWNIGKMREDMDSMKNKLEEKEPFYKATTETLEDKVEELEIENTGLKAENMLLKGEI